MRHRTAVWALVGAMACSACTTIHGGASPDDTSTAVAISAATMGQPSGPDIEVSTQAIQPAADVSGPVNNGCIDVAGVRTGSAASWYRHDAAGAVVLDIGEYATGTSAATALQDALLAALLDDAPGFTREATWEFTAPGAPSCTVGRGAAVAAPDGSAIRVSVWRSTAAAQLGSLPQHAPFTAVGTDLLVSDGRTSGDVSILAVLPDGTTIKLVALGHDALGFAGWPTTIAPRPEAGPPQAPTIELATLEDIARAMAQFVNAARTPGHEAAATAPTTLGTPVPGVDVTSGTGIRVEVGNACPGSIASIAGFSSTSPTSVDNPDPTGLSDSFVPGAPISALVCRYGAVQGQQGGVAAVVGAGGALFSETRLDATAAAGLATAANVIEPSSLAFDCSPPDDQPRYTVIAFEIAGRSDVDVWLKDFIGCPVLSNGWRDSGQLVNGLGHDFLALLAELAPPAPSRVPGT